MCAATGVSTGTAALARRVALCGERATERFARSLHHIGFFTVHGKAAIIVYGDAFQELRKGPGLVINYERYRPLDVAPTLRMRVSFGGVMSWICSWPRSSLSDDWRSALQLTFS